MQTFEEKKIIKIKKLLGTVLVTKKKVYDFISMITVYCVNVVILYSV